MRRVRVLGVGSDDKPLLQHRREAVPVEVNPALDAGRRAKRRRLYRSVGGGGFALRPGVASPFASRSALRSLILGS